ncbi:hypothetical protein QUF79_06095 [Fictibacillus enclensis]|uniref:DEAD/DEAH box helicase family protein n=1 Tax=Fictibacillus enclensis TaxID=1017270 RepID=UPI0025A1EFF5|nr:DEAD/DEAH box helicase family protein [Fictibacillus enclensis]MDM5197586.1 hypothetical protein [Fictibacillus enclensis]
MRNKIYVSDVITVDVVKQLEKGKNYLIGSEMGSGKNHWARNILLPYALDNRKRTLIVTHRAQTKAQQNAYLAPFKEACERQFLGGLFRTESYQTFSNMIKRNDPEILQFDYIVHDEAHALVSDASFNTQTEVVFNFLNENTNAIKILMTGTYEGLGYLPWKNKLEILKEANYYNNNINNLYRYEEDETILAIVDNEVKQGNKVLVFHNSKDTTSHFNVGKAAVLHSGNRHSSEEFNQIAETQQFDVDVLNTTKLMTEATEIKDKKLKVIINHGLSDIDAVAQAPARSRDEEGIDYYYKRISKRSIVTKLNHLDKQLGYYEKFTELGEIEFVNEYGLDIIHKSMKAFYLDTVIDPISNQQYTRLRVSNTGLASLSYQYDYYEFMNEHGFEAAISKYFPDKAYIDLEQLKREGFIQLDIVDNYVDKKIFKDQQQELCNVICNKYGLRAKNGSTKVGMKTINSFFEENSIPFQIESKKESKGENRNKMYWILNKIS